MQIFCIEYDIIRQYIDFQINGNHIYIKWLIDLDSTLTICAHIIESYIELYNIDMDDVILEINGKVEKLQNGEVLDV